MASFRRISPPTIMSKPRKLKSNMFFIWGKSHHSITNSTQLVTAAIWYSGLWLSRNESVDNLSGLYFATMTYSEKWKNESDTKYQPKYFHFVSPKLKRRAIPKTLPNENKENIIIYLCVVDQAWDQDDKKLATFFFCLSIIDLDRGRVANASHLGLTSLVNKAVIIWISGKFSCGPQQGALSGQDSAD